LFAEHPNNRSALPLPGVARALRSSEAQLHQLLRVCLGCQCLAFVTAPGTFCASGSWRLFFALAWLRRFLLADFFLRDELKWAVPWPVVIVFSGVSNEYVFGNRIFAVRASGTQRALWEGVQHPLQPIGASGSK
jgi:hypothetical protein